jgi:hypothetical protein
MAYGTPCCSNYYNSLGVLKSNMFVSSFCNIYKMVVMRNYSDTFCVRWPDYKEFVMCLRLIKL